MVILVEDEMRLTEESGIKPIWYERGKYPVVKVSRKKQAVNFYGALNVKTGKSHLRDFPRQTSFYTVQFLDGLYEEYIVRQKKQKIILLWDGAPWHFGQVRKYLKGKYWLEIVSFPPYSPDLNPQEHVWKDGREHVSHNSELSLEDKALKFFQHIVSKKFSYTFMQKYFGSI